MYRLVFQGKIAFQKRNWIWESIFKASTLFFVKIKTCIDCNFFTFFGLLGLNLTVISLFLAIYLQFSKAFIKSLNGKSLPCQRIDFVTWFHSIFCLDGPRVVVIQFSHDGEWGHQPLFSSIRTYIQHSINSKSTLYFLKYHKKNAYSHNFIISVIPFH